MSNYRIGTSGYSYDDWEAVFYPPGTPKGKRLDYYATHFDTVEINSTYYSIPNAAVFFHLQRKTPEHFDFIVKVHRETTHSRQENERAMKALHAAIRPLTEAGKFRGFLAQFPYSFKNTPASRDYLLTTRQLAEPFPLFVEFRNWTWNRPELSEFLQKNDIGYVNVDEPPLRGLLPAQDIATTKTAYVRFHGRNLQNWWEGSNETRYNYLYSERELKEWLLRLTSLIKKSFRSYIFFNNHPQGKAVQNARMLKKMLDTELTDNS